MRPLQPPSLAHVATRAVRDAWAFAANPLRFLERLPGRGESIVRRRLMGRTTLVVLQPELVEEVLLTQARRFTKAFGKLRATSPYGQGLLTSEGPHWLAQRRLMQPGFLPRAQAPLLPRVLVAGEGLMATWPVGEPFDLRPEAQRLMRRVFLATLARPDTALDIAALDREFEVLPELLEWRVKIPIRLTGWVLLPGRRRFEAAQRSARAFIRALVAEERAAREPDAGVLAGILAARDPEGRAMPELAIEDEVFSLFLAGHEPTALTLTIALHLLAHHPEVQAEAAAELQAVTAGGPIAPEHLPRCEALRRILTEVLRLYPPTYAMLREAREPTVLGEVPVRRGHLVVLPQWLIHRDARHFPEPLAFRPSRWTREFERGLPRLAYFPFGGGPHLCIGNHAALQQVQGLLAMCLHRYRIEPASPPELRLGGGIALRLPEPVEVRLVPRAQGPG
ncbi:MAG: cytochrome P450 [Candidatus Sericytochromatia bacterium]|nr:cytochrome P450 [Candidatus Sericytochromatia bacterium]